MVECLGRSAKASVKLMLPHKRVAVTDLIGREQSALTKSETYTIDQGRNRSRPFILQPKPLCPKLSRSLNGIALFPNESFPHCTTTTRRSSAILHLGNASKTLRWNSKRLRRTGLFPLQHFRSRSLQKAHSKVAFPSRKCHLRCGRNVNMWIENALYRPVEVGWQIDVQQKVAGTISFGMSVTCGYDAMWRALPREKR